MTSAITRAEETDHEPVAGEPLLAVRNLRISFPVRGQRDRVVTPVEDVSFDVRRGQRLAIVGESGSGKSLTALGIMGLARRVGGRVSPDSQVLFAGTDVLRLPEEEGRKLRGGSIGMIFQDPLSSLNPVHSVGAQVAEAVALHRRGLDRTQARRLVLDLLDQVRLPRVERVARSYPHELSGGMRQRVMIAMALAGDPKILIADEPTTALDVTVQASVLDLVYELSDERDLATLLITHDLSVVAGFSDRVLVMYGGRVVEEGETSAIFARPHHPYTAALLSSIPPLDSVPERLTAIPGAPPEPAARPSGCVFRPRCAFARDECATDRPPLVGSASRVACFRADEIDLSRLSLELVPERQPAPTADPGTVVLAARGLSKRYRTGGVVMGREVVHALTDVDLEVHRGDVLGVVGESGSGKSTLALCLGRLIEPTEGSVVFEGRDVTRLKGRDLRALRRNLQTVFQDPTSSLDPRMPVREILAEPLRIHRWGTRREREARLRELLDMVRLPSDSLDRYPRQFSGGQLQRIAIARAMALKPGFLICDEPVSALDVSVRSTVLNLVKDLQEELDLTVLFIAHDLALVRYLCNRVAVMHQGRLVELADAETLFSAPQHPHTKELLAAHPEPHPEQERARRRERMAQTRP